jgi:predicted permease
MQAILAAVLPVAIIVLIGFTLARFGRPVQGEMIRMLVADVGSPALIFTALQKVDASGALLRDYTLAGLVALILLGLIGYVGLRLAKQSIRAFLPSIIFGNTGNLGLPLALYACGPVGLGYAAIIHTLTAVGNFTVGHAIASGSTQWKPLLRSPPIIAAIAGVAALLLHLQFPLWLRNTLELASNFTIPLMLLMLGTSLATIKVVAIRRASGLAIFRVGLGIAVGFGVSWLFGLTGVPRAIMVMQVGGPVAVYNYLFAVANKTDPEGVASLVVVSTLIAAVTVPVLLAILT